ncbi:MAG: RteC domain-containing protein, partial [Bacteroides sp.]|nr:RteC domain-containing protein [Bacteroides sp.]
WTGNAIDLVELIYGIDVMGCINNGNMPLKQLAPLLYKIFGVESKDCYRFYIDIKRRKNESRTYFLDKMQEKLNEKMLRDEEMERMRR